MLSLRKGIPRRRRCQARNDQEHHATDPELVAGLPSPHLPAVPFPATVAMVPFAYNRLITLLPVSAIETSRECKNSVPRDE